MRTAAIVIAAQSCALAAIIGAVVLALYGKDGWGWFLGLGVLLGLGLTVKTGGKA